jgi:hypothetical protein
MIFHNPRQLLDSFPAVVSVCACKSNHIVRVALSQFHNDAIRIVRYRTRAAPARQKGADLVDSRVLALDKDALVLFQILKQVKVNINDREILLFLLWRVNALTSRSGCHRRTERAGTNRAGRASQKGAATHRGHGFLLKSRFDLHPANQKGGRLGCQEADELFENRPGMVYAVLWSVDGTMWTTFNGIRGLTWAV